MTSAGVGGTPVKAAGRDVDSTPTGPASGVVVRMWEVRVAAGHTEEYLDVLLRMVLPGLRTKDGLLAAEVFRPLGGDVDERLVLITRWRDVVSLESAAGPQWRSRPVTAEAEVALQARPEHVWHFSLVGTGP